MGSRSSEQFARCYNEKGFTRFELELKDKKARLAAKKIFDVDEAELPALALGMVRGFVDFCEPGSRREHDKLLPWWSEFVGMFEGVVLSIPKKVQKVLEDALSYVVVQHGKTLKAAFQAFGFSEVLDRIDEQRFSVKHRRMLADYYKQKEADELRLFRQPSDLCGQIGMCT
jgi:DNA relaxase NicK